MKAPNILIRTTIAENFKKHENVMNCIVKPDNYTIYHLNDDKFFKEPWHDACVLLLFEYTSFKVEDLKMVATYLNNHNGRVLFHGDVEHDEVSLLLDNMDLNANISQRNTVDFKIDLGKMVSESDFKLHASILKRNLINIPVKQLIDIICDLGVEVGVETEDLSSLPAYFYSIDSNIMMSQVFNLQGLNATEISGDKLKICFSEEAFEKNDIDQSGDIIFNVLCNAESSSFNWELYKNKIKTKCYGRKLIYKSTMESTQDIFMKLPTGAIKADGFVVIAAQQTKGRGRGNNKWLSPVGCMMFSMQIKIPLQSSLGQRISFIQHIVVVAFIISIKERKGYEELEINIKWPNDIYIKRNIKIGGVIVNSSFFDNEFNVVIGLGVNVSNNKPTECVNSLIREHNLKHDSTLEEICIEDVLAGTMNKIEYLVDLFHKESVEKFKQIYYKCWLHGHTQVTLEFENNVEATVTGLDDFGYLEVQLHDGRKLCLQPEGNSFDMMRNMISLKK